MTDLEMADSYLILCELLAGRSLPSAWGEVEAGVWEFLARLAVAEGVGPLLYHYLKQYRGLQLVPAAPRQALADAWYTAAARSQLLLNEWERMAGALAAAHVPVLVYKGGALAAGLYADPALRPMTDLDLLTPPEHLPRALAVLGSLGYQQQKVSYHVVLENGARPPIQVEVHWSLAPAGASQALPAMEWFWQQRQPDRTAGYTLSPGAHLLALAAHLMLQHAPLGQDRLLWYYDIHLLVKKYAASLDWPVVIAQARRLGWEAALYRVLLETRTRLETPMPADVLEALTPAASPGLAAPRRAAPAPAPQGAQKIWTRRALAVLPWRSRLRLLWGLAFPAPAYLRWRYRPRPAAGHAGVQ